MNLLPLGATVNCGEVWYSRCGTYGPRVQHALQLVSMHDGELDIDVDGESRHVASGQSILLLPGGREYFQFSRRKRSRHAWVQVEAATYDASLLSALVSVPAVAASSESLVGLMRIGWLLQAGGEPHTGALRAVAVAALREHLAACGFSTAGRRGPLPQPLTRALRFIEENMALPLTASTLGRGASTSYQHLARLFLAALGCSPMEAVWRRRCDRAATLLTATGLTLAEIAEQCGFTSEQHFSRRFRSSYGKPPGQFRHEAEGAPADSVG